MTAGAVRAQIDVPPPDGEEQKKLFADLTANALEFSAHLPNFTCIQSTRRNIDLKGTSQRWKLTETIVERLTYVDHKESYATTVNGKPVSGRPAGLMSLSDFSNILSWAFDPKKRDDLAWQSWDTLRGARVHVVGYHVPQAKSLFTVGAGKNKITTGFFGVAFIDKDTAAVLRLAVIASDIPPKYPLQAVNMELHYDYAKIGGQMYLVPLKAEYHAKDGKSLIWDEVEFRDYAAK